MARLPAREAEQPPGPAAIPLALVAHVRAVYAEEDGFPRALCLASAVPASLANWALLLGTALLAGIPFAVLTSRPEIGALLVRAGLAATPEELAPPPVVEAAGHVLRPAPEIGTTPAPVAGSQL